MNNIVKIIFSFFLLGLSFSSCSQKLTLEVTALGKIRSSDLYLKERKIYLTKIELINITNESIRFWMRSCSWEDNFIFSVDSCKFIIECAKNIPYIRKINPKSRLVSYGVIESNSSQMRDLKIGFVLVGPREVKEASHYSKVLENKKDIKKDIFWSNVFNFDELDTISLSLILRRIQTNLPSSY